jgi:polar amino acid transport system substrate-binding protein
MMRSRTILALLLAFGLLAAACGDDDSTATSGDEEPAADGGEDAEGGEDVDGGGPCDELPTKTEGVLAVATGEPVFPPWMEDDDPSNGRGFESALVYALADELGIDTVEWVRTGFDEAIAPGAKDYDFNIQQYSITADRDEVVDFSDGYYQVEQAIIGAADADIASATSLGDLVDARLGAAVGTTSLDYIDDVIQPNNDASVYNDNADAKSAFDAGQVDGIVFDLPTAYYITAVEIPEASIIGVLPRSGVAPEELGMLFEEGSPLVECVNAALATLHSNGTIEALEDEWLNQGGSIPSLSE